MLAKYALTGNITADHALAALADPQARIYKRPALVTPRTVDVKLGSTEYTFSYLADAKWRLGYVSTYGNGHFVTGPGCDASGFVITDPAVITALETWKGTP